jgi:hypothetical protein
MADDNGQSFLNPSRRSYVYESSKSSGSKARIILIIIGIIILIALIAFAVIATGGKGEGEKELTPTPPPPTEAPTPTTEASPTPSGKVTPSPTPKASPTPAKGTPTPTPKGGSSSVLDRSDLSVAVQNGSGTAGAATKASDALKKLGYDVVSSGNADNFDYTDVTIQVKGTKKAYLQQLKDDLSDDYTIGSATSDYTGTDADALIIIGK